MAVVNWENAGLLPFGMDACAIDYLITPDNGTLGVSALSAFWKTLTNNLPADRGPAVIVAMQTGLALYRTFVEGREPEPAALSEFTVRCERLQKSFAPLCYPQDNLRN